LARVTWPGTLRPLSGGFCTALSTQAPPREAQEPAALITKEAPAPILAEASKPFPEGSSGEGRDKIFALSKQPIAPTGKQQPGNERGRLVGRQGIDHHLPNHDQTITAKAMTSAILTGLVNFLNVL